MALTQALLKERLHYNPDTGVFTWLVAPRYPSKVKIGDTAGNDHPSGYQQVTVAGHKVLLHRAAWLYVNGQIPDGKEIDHRDGDKSNNRIKNLRLATHQQNQENLTTCRSDSKSGLQGVSWRSQNSKWVVRIMVKGKRKHVGTFTTKAEAHTAYLEAKRELHEFCTI